MKKVLASGVFDKFHVGHIHFLTEAKKLGDYLVVIVTSDASARGVFNKNPTKPEGQRAEILRSLRMVDEVRIGYDLSNGDRTFMDMAGEIMPDVVALGYDQKPAEGKLEEDLRNAGIDAKVVRISKREDAVK